MKKALSLVLALIMLFALMSGCGSSGAAEQPAEAPEAPANDAPAAEEPADEAPAEEAPAAEGENVLRFGMVCDFASPFGLDAVNGMQAWCEYKNAQGGIPVGDDMYLLEGIFYDTTGDQVTANTAVERLIFEDKVDYIVSDNSMVDSWLHIAEENQTVALISTNSTVCFNPDWHYIYETGTKNCSTASYTQWLVNHVDFESAALVHPDSSTGEIDANAIRDMILLFKPDAKVELISYPGDSSDLSSTGTRIAASNPDFVMSVGGGPILDCQVISVAKQAGYTGQLALSGTITYGQQLEFVGAENAEGLISGANPVEFDPGLTEFSEEFRQAYIAKFGEWNDPEVACSHAFYALVYAVQEAGSVDKEAVCEVLSNGLEYEGPLGHSIMVPRPDQGNDRTVDSVAGFIVKQIVDGERVIPQDGEISLETAVGAFNIYLDSLAG